MISISSKSSRLLASSLLQHRRTQSRSTAFVQNVTRRKFATPPPPPSPAGGGPKPPPPPPSSSSSSNSNLKVDVTKNRGPVSWMSLFLVGVAAASVTAYYKLERERRLEKAMRKVVSSESDGWSPNPEVLAKRKFKRTPWGWFPEEDAFGAGESHRVLRLILLDFDRVVDLTRYTRPSHERSTFWHPVYHFFFVFWLRLFSFSCVLLFYLLCSLCVCVSSFLVAPEKNCTSATPL